jgi:hypothetical protein
VTASKPIATILTHMPKANNKQLYTEQKIEEIAEQWTRLILAQINYRGTNPVMRYQYQNKYDTKNN